MQLKQESMIIGKYVFEFKELGKYSTFFMN